MVALGDLADHGVDVIGEIEGAVPVPALPSVGWDELLALVPGALAIAIIGYAETATGLANVLAGAFQGFITGGGASQSAANDNLPAMRRIRRLRRDSFALAMFTLLGVLLLGVLGGLLLAVVITIVLLLNRQSRPGPRSRTCSAAAA